MLIKRYTKNDEASLFELLKNAGEEWVGYYGEGQQDKYKTVLGSSITYVAYEADVLCGYCRCRNDDGYGIYVYDLLVDKKHRGKSYGRLLMERVSADFPEDAIYVMSDVDKYYEKQGYQRIGSIFEVSIPSKIL